jgi:parvulin-like peptidyl-prolyl isomerase
MFARQAFLPMLASVLAFFVATLALGQTPPPAPRNPAPTVSAQIIPVSMSSEHVAASVNGEKILVGEVKKILDQRPYPMSLTEDQKKQVRQAALDILIEDAVMRQYLSKQVPQVSQADYTKEMKEFEEALKKGPEKTIQQFLSKSGQTEDQLRRDIVARLQWRTLLHRYYPDDKLRSYYDANKPFFDKVFVKASHILLKLPPQATKEQRDQAMQKMLVWRQEILTGKMTFEDVARKYSECPSKDKGGDIGQFPYKFVVVPEFARVAFAMKDGEISNVVPTVFGLHLIKVVERTKGEPSNFETVRETIREVWAEDDNLYQRVLTDQRKASDIKVLLP